ncbi:MAG: STAS domain-containing protein [Candidatus Ozemobacteraceae bacterium]
MTQKQGSFNFTITEERDVVVVAMEGYFTDTSTEMIEKQLLPALMQGKIRIVIDFSRISLMNSPGIASLLELLMKIREEFLGKSVLCGISPLLKEIFQMAGVTPMFLTAEDKDDAMETAHMK